MKRAREPETVEHAGAAASSAADEQSPLASIKAALGTGKAQVCCQGALQLDPLPTVAGTDEAGKAFAVRLPLDVEAGSSGEAATTKQLQPLLDACEPAKFGKGTELVLDDSYRKALALPIERCATKFDPAAHGILRDVQALLMPETVGVSATLHKLNVYEPGGFFKAHRDTPRSDGFFGSLVVCLPVHHEGGELVVRHGGHEQARTEWGAEADVKDGTVRWVAFYSDCEHEVEPVKGGYRITLTYELTAQKQNAAAARKQDQLPVSDVAARGTPLFGTIRAALQDPTFLPDGSILGIACSHEYATTARKRLTPDMLKGGDALTYAVAAQLNLQPALKFVFHTYGEDWEDFGEEGRDAFMTLDSHLGNITENFVTEDQGEALSDAGAQDADRVTWLNQEALTFGDNKHSFMCFGNDDAYKTVMYSAAAILLTVPDAPRRRHP